MLSQKEAEIIRDWPNKNFIFPNEKWTHFGCLGAIGEYVLSCHNGNILEIGVGESSVYLSALAEKYQRRIFHCDVNFGYFHRFIEFGNVFLKDNVLINKDTQHVPNNKCVLFCGTSDDFFKTITFPVLSYVFIDGYHSYEQVKRDFYNVLPYVEEDGYILLHDTYPPEDTIIKGALDSYKFRQELEKDDRFDCLTLTQGTAFNMGLTIVRKKVNNRQYFQ